MLKFKLPSTPTLQPIMISSETPAPVTSTPTSEPTLLDGECPYFSLNFKDCKAGQYVHGNLWYTHGVKITAILKSNRDAQKGFTPILGKHVEAGGGASQWSLIRQSPRRPLGNLIVLGPV
jgi:hypothetical protein